MRQPIPLHPFLFALFPIISIYLFNKPLVSPVEFLATLGVCAAGATLLVVAIVVFCKDRARGGLVLSAGLLVFFTYGHVQYALDGHPLGALNLSRPRYLLVAFGLLFLLGVWLVRRARRVEGAVRVFSVIGVVAILSAVIRFVPQEISSQAAAGRVRAELAALPGPRAEDPYTPPSPGKQPPDIYYIILDRYTSPAALQQYLNYDNSELTGYLRGKGFYIAPQSRCNYIGTYLSLTSSLNMRHLNDLSPKLKRSIGSPAPIYEALRQHEVGRYLKRRGYQYLHLGSWWLPTRTNPQADANGATDLTEITEFPIVVARSTMLHPFLLEAIWDDIAHRQRCRVRYNLETMAELPRRPGPPRFVMAHFTIPHPPYVFGPDGKALRMRETWGRPTRELFLDQVRFVNARLMELIGELLGPGSRPAVIILQGDEGPRPSDVAVGADKETQRAASHGSDTREPDNLALHSSILNAIYVPGGAQALYPTITPVNTFRVIFNQCFRTDYPLLPDRVYASAGESRPCAFEDITSQVR